jgi:isopentenyl-diphosphate delta-isomerase
LKPPVHSSSDEPGDDVEKRKAEHLRLASSPEVGARVSPGWDDVQLVHEALPRADLAAIDMSVDFLGRRLSAPLLIAGMTGGHGSARAVNAVLARAAQRHGLAMGLGSQRAGLNNPALAPTYAVAREEAPDAFLIANIGAAQLVSQSSGKTLETAHLQMAVDMIGADALAVHLNFLEESVQPEGDRRAVGLREALAAALRLLEVPGIAKETGAGMSRATALELRELGFSALDVGGAGGTSFAAVEGRRAKDRGDRRGERLGHVFHDWGVPTAVSVVAAGAAGLPLIATGGVRSGLHAAKAIALGASLVGVARPLLQAAMEGDDAVDEWITHFIEELRVAVFLTGGTSVADLARAPRVVLGDTRRWLEDLGY